MDKTLFGDRLRELRKERSLQQSELGEIFGLSPSAIGSYERGLREPMYSILVAFAEYFNVSTDYMLGASDERLTLDAYVSMNAIDLEEFLASSSVKLRGVTMTEEDKQRLSDMAIALIWSRLK